MSEEIVTYVSKRAPGFGFNVRVNGRRERIKCVNRMFTVSADQVDLIAAIDAAITANPNIAREFEKVDRAAAERVAREFVSRQRAVKGGFTTAGLNQMQAATIQASAQALDAAAPNNPEALAAFRDELAHGAMEVTEHVVQQGEFSEPPAPPAPAAPPPAPAPSAARTLLNRKS